MWFIRISENLKIFHIFTWRKLADIYCSVISKKFFWKKHVWYFDITKHVMASEFCYQILLRAVSLEKLPHHVDCRISPRWSCFQINLFQSCIQHSASLCDVIMKKRLSILQTTKRKKVKYFYILKRVILFGTY